MTTINNEDLQEKFSKDVFRKKRNKNVIRNLSNSDEMCQYGVDCRKKLCGLKHPQYFNHHLMLKYKKEIELEKHKRDFKKESRIFMHKYRNRELIKNILKVKSNKNGT
ncbi:hypothetical protein C1645_831580 [Glomus cerebriforme]|uniref:Uncharacterized protein n=1 Tax=Glomus cerebriforme TaxID=658196 RepID=A0A397SJ44_9GLOM|nr:hypothetical protein C1645_831580 [Glomus cerebriforme]